MTTSISLTINWDKKPVNTELLKKINQSVNYHCPDGDLIWQNGHIGMTQANLVTLPEDDPNQIIHTENLTIVASCRIDNREELIAILKPQCPLVNNTDTAVILAGYQVYEEKIVEKLVGDFAFIIWDQNQEKIIAGRDFFGLRRLFYYADEKKLIIASEYSQIFQDSSLTIKPKKEDIIKFLTSSFLYCSGFDLGWYEGVTAINAGYIFTAQQGKIKQRKFWHFEDLSDSQKSDSDWIEEYLFTLKQAVNCNLRSSQPVGIELSGGLDSSAVAALAGETGKQYDTLSMTFPSVPQVDETQRIKEVLALYPSLNPNFFNAEDLYMPLYLRNNWQPQALFSPYETLSAPLSDLAGFACQSGIKVALTGVMGDVLNEGSEDLFYDLLAQGNLGELITRFGYAWQHSPKKAIFSLVCDGFLPFLPSSAYYSTLALRMKQRAKKFGRKLPSYLNPEYRARIIEVDQQIKLDLLKNIYSLSAVSRNTLNFLYPPPVVLTMALPFPLERRHPYCDRRLVELVLSMPPQLKWESQYQGRVSAGRFHHRQALKSKLPDSIINDRVSVEFSPAFHRCVNGKIVSDWLQQSSTTYIIEQGYVDGDLWQKNIESLQNSFKYNNYLVVFLALESWLRFLGN